MQGDWYALLASPVMLPVILLLTFVIYAPTLNDWFVADDFWFLRASQTTPIGEYTRQAFDFRDTDPVADFQFYRPMYLVSFRLCYAVFGLNATGYHAVNLTLHLGSVVLLWMIARRITNSVLLANATALIFAIHPAYTETVSWIARGNTVMTTLVYLGTLLLFMQHLDEGRRSWYWYAASVAAFVLALLYHTTSLTLIVLLPAYAFLVAWQPRRMLAPQAWLRFVPFVLAGLAMVAIQTSSSVALEDSGFEAGWHQISRYREYLGLSLFPVLPDDWRSFNMGGTPVLKDVYLGAAVAMLALTAVVVARRSAPYVGLFAALWLYLAIGPNSTFIYAFPVTGAIPAQLYLPGVPLALFFVLAFRAIGEGLPPAYARAGRIALCIAAPVLIIFAASLNARHEDEVNAFAQENERFISELRASAGEIPRGGKIYLVGAPFSLRIFDDSQLRDAIALYYDGVEIEQVRDEDVPALRASLEPDERMFVFSPGEAGRLPSAPE